MILTGRYTPNLGFGSDTIFYSAGSVVNDLTLYEGVLTVWKEKVDFDRVRPTSIIQDQLAGTVMFLIFYFFLFCFYVVITLKHNAHIKKNKRKRIQKMKKQMVLHIDNNKLCRHNRRW